MRAARTTPKRNTRPFPISKVKFRASYTFCLVPPVLGWSALRAGNHDKTEAAYRALPDFRLQDLAIRFGIKPKKIMDAFGDRYVFDRRHIIAAPPATRSRCRFSLAARFKLQRSHREYAQLSADAGQCWLDDQPAF